VLNLKLLLVFCLASAQLYAQERLAVRFNEQGILKVLTMAVRYNSAGRQDMVIPQNLYDFVLKKDSVNVNPLIRMLGQIRGIDLSNDLPFYLKTSDIHITGAVDERSLLTEISNSSNSGFDVRLSLTIPSLAVQSAEMTLCQNRQAAEKDCADGIKVQVKGLRIAAVNKPITISSVFRFRNDGRVARLSVKSVESSLSGPDAPNLDISFESLVVPPANFVDGLITPIVRRRLRETFSEQRQFLSDKLISFAAKFLTNDVVEMMNLYLVDRDVVTSYVIHQQKNGSITFDQFVANRAKRTVPPYRPRATNVGADPMERMLNQISDVLKSSQVAVSLNRIATPGNKDVELLGLVDFKLGNHQITSRNTLGNSRRTLPRLDLSSQRRNDFNLVFSEPLINAALDLANSADLFQKMLESVATIQGVQVKNVKLHFAGDQALVGVVNVEVDLKKLESRGMRSRLTNLVVSFLERNNNNGIIFFPIEISMVPTLRRLRDGGMGFDIRVVSPFTNRELPNQFNYPTNIPLTTDIVKDGIMGKLKESLEPHTNKTYNVDVTRFLKKSGVEFKLKSIGIKQGSYLVLGVDIVDIKFDALTPN
jgi:hypothetical protein